MNFICYFQERKKKLRLHLQVKILSSSHRINTSHRETTLEMRLYK